MAVVERAAQGRAEVRFEAPAGWTLRALALNHAYKFGWLAERKGADGIVLARPPGGGWQAHIVECKAKINDDKWREIRAQFAGSHLRLLAACGVIGIRVERVCLYTAYRRDQIGVESPDPLIFEAEMAHGPHMSGRVMWRTGRVDIAELGRVQHRRVALRVADGVGRAEITLG